MNQKIKCSDPAKEIRYNSGDSYSTEETKEFGEHQKSKVGSDEAIDEDIIIEALTEETLKTMVYGFKVIKDDSQEYMQKNYLKKITREVYRKKNSSEKSQKPAPNQSSGEVPDKDQNIIIDSQDQSQINNPFDEKKIGQDPSLQQDSPQNADSSAQDQSSPNNESSSNAQDSASSGQNPIIKNIIGNTMNIGNTHWQNNGMMFQHTGDNYYSQGPHYHFQNASSSENDKSESQKQFEALKKFLDSEVISQMTDIKQKLNVVSNNLGPKVDKKDLQKTNEEIKIATDIIASSLMQRAQMASPLALHPRSHEELENENKSLEQKIEKLQEEKRKLMQELQIAQSYQRPQLPVLSFSKPVLSKEPPALTYPTAVSPASELSSPLASQAHKSLLANSDSLPDELTPEEKDALMGQVKESLKSDPIAIYDDLLDLSRRSHLNVLWECTVGVKNTFLNGDKEEITLDFRDITYINFITILNQRMPDLAVLGLVMSNTEHFAEIRSFAINNFPMHVKKLEYISSSPRLDITALAYEICSVSRCVTNSVYFSKLKISSRQFKLILSSFKHLPKIYFSECLLDLKKSLDLESALQDSQITLLSINNCGNALGGKWKSIMPEDYSEEILSDAGIDLHPFVSFLKSLSSSEDFITKINEESAEDDLGIQAKGCRQKSHQVQDCLQALGLEDLKLTVE
ncbi:unnamed protein product [Moneuplotes crassus]|uniref:Uncharacterized protein n=1 Tax=Euplotes crassus TaxID=5936 RepID=A0AAD2D644_EUPCR|nr:unnamed protein product [Moneuplotes crassus]